METGKQKCLLWLLAWLQNCKTEEITELPAVNTGNGKHAWLPL